MRVHTLVHVDADGQTAAMAQSMGPTDVDAAISLDIEAQAVRAAAQLNYTRAREEEAAREAALHEPDEYEPEVIIPATGRN